ANLSGCASLVLGTGQTVAVEAHAPDGAPINGANCKLTNTKGVWYVQTPGNVTVHRAYGDLSTRCELSGYDVASFQSKSTNNGLMIGNIIFGGIIGIAVDAGTGAAYDYPDVIHAQMTKTPPEPMAGR